MKNSTVIAESVKTCKQCLKTLPTIQNFFKAHGNKDLYKNICKHCSVKNNHLNNKTLNTYLKRLLSTARSSSLHREKIGRLDASEMTLTFEEINELWKEQNGLCYYSNIPMNTDKREWRMSLERLNPQRGYHKNNCVLCCLEFNGCVQWSKDKIKDMLNLLNEKKEVVNAFFLNDVSYNCSNENGKRKRNFTCRYHLQRLVNNAAKKSKLRNETKPRKGLFEIDFDFLCELYSKQNGRCAYSNIPLQFRTDDNNSFDWKCSLERKDPRYNYTKENTVLICLEFNTTDNAMKCLDLVARFGK